MPTFCQLKEYYPEIKDISGYISFTTGSVQIDGHYSTNELRQIARFIENYNLAFGQWYEKCLKIESRLSLEPVNAFYHNFADGKSPQEAVDMSSQYGIEELHGN